MQGSSSIEGIGVGGLVVKNRRPWIFSTRHRWSHSLVSKCSHYLCMRFRLGTATPSLSTDCSAIPAFVFRNTMVVPHAKHNLVVSSCLASLSQHRASFRSLQPVPGPLSRFFHFKPRAWHRFETFFGLWVVELLTPPLLLLPSLVPALVNLRASAATLQVSH